MAVQPALGEKGDPDSDPRPGERAASNAASVLCRLGLTPCAQDNAGKTTLLYRLKVGADDPKSEPRGTSS